MPNQTKEAKSGWTYVLWGLGIVVLIFIIAALVGAAGKKSTETVIVIPPTPVPTNTPIPTTTTVPTVAPTEEAQAPSGVVTPGEMEYVLADTDWKVSSLDGYPYSSNDLDKAGISLKFIGRTTLSGYDGCGNYKTTYKENPEKGSLYVDPEILMEVVTPTPDADGNIGSYCEDLSDEGKEARKNLLENLPNVTKYEVDGTTLKLYDQNGTLVLTARKTS